MSCQSVAVEILEICLGVNDLKYVHKNSTLPRSHAKKWFLSECISFSVNDFISALVNKGNKSLVSDIFHRRVTGMAQRTLRTPINRFSKT